MRRRSLLLLVALLGLLGGLVAHPAQAQGAGDSGGLVIREVDSTDPDAVKVTFLYDGDRANLPQLTLREQGRTVEASEPVSFQDENRLGVILLIDISESMKDNAAIERARDAAIAYVEERGANEEIALITFGGEVTLVEDFTTDQDTLVNDLEGVKLSAGGGTKLWDGLSRAAGLYEDSSLQPNILLLSDGADTTSELDADSAFGALATYEASVFAVGIESEDFNPAILGDIADQTGGLALTTTDPTELSALFGDIQQTLARQYTLTFESNATNATGPTELTLSVGNASHTVEYTPGAVQAGAGSLKPAAIDKPFGPDFMRDSGGLYLAVLLVLAAVGMLVYSLIAIFGENRSALESALQPYAEGYVADDDDDDDERNKGYAQTQLLQRAVEITGQFAEQRGILTRIEGRLEQANLPLRAAEALFFYMAAVVVGTLLSLVLSRNLVVAAVVLLGFALLAPAILSFLANRRRKQFESMLPDTLQLLSSTLRAGYSLMQGVEAVSQEVAEPMRRELQRVVTEARLGRPLEVALEGVADRMGSLDFAWAVMAIGIQREVGGNLSELLMTVAETMTQRERLRRDVAALTAEGKISAIVLGALPLLLMFAMWGINPDYIGVLFDETMGQIALGGGILLMLVGFYWMKKVIDIEI